MLTHKWIWIRICPVCDPMAHPVNKRKDCQLLAPILADLLVLLANLLEHTSGPTKISAEDLVGSCLGIVEGPERAFETLKSLPRVEAVVNQQVTLSVLKRVSGRMLK